MKRSISLLLAAAFLMSVSGCAADSHKERDDWQQYRAHKGQEELSKEVQGSKP